MYMRCSKVINKLHAKVKRLIWQLLSKTGIFYADEFFLNQKLNIFANQLGVRNVCNFPKP